MTKTLGVLVHGAGWVSTQHIAALQRNPAHARSWRFAARSIEEARCRATEFGLGGHRRVRRSGQGARAAGRRCRGDLHSATSALRERIQAAQAGKHLIIEKPVGISLEELRQDARRGARGRRQDRGQFRAALESAVSHAQDADAGRRAGASLLRRSGLPEPQRQLVVGLECGPHAWSTASVRCWSAAVTPWMPCGGLPRRANSKRPGRSRCSPCPAGTGKGSTREYNPLTNRGPTTRPPWNTTAWKSLLVKFSNGAVGKVSVNADCIMPYRFPIRIFGDRGSLLDNRMWSHKFPGQTDWLTLPTILPDSSDVKHHPFQAEIDHFVDCVLDDVESHCNLDDAILTHEVVFAAQECYRSGRPVALPLI